MVKPYPKTSKEWCDRFKELDKEFGTDKRSPLHHDNRCPIHRSNGKES